jgi:hypothetical protein
MLRQNIDFFAVSIIVLVMLAFAEVRSWHFPEGLDSFRVENAIDVEHCPISRQVLAGLNSILH